MPLFRIIIDYVFYNVNNFDINCSFSTKLTFISEDPDDFTQNHRLKTCMNNDLQLTLEKGRMMWYYKNIDYQKTEGDFMSQSNGIKIVTIDELNRRAENVQAFIETSENQYREKVITAAESIAQCCKQKPLVLLSGPSGSGKTTTAYRIADVLVSKGIKAVVISMDDYFVPGVIQPDENGKVDLEAPARVDCELLKKDLRTLAAGGEVRLPKFDFTDNSRQQGNKIRCDGNTVVIIEGIHALNPEVTGKMHDSATFIYVSVRTRIADEKGGLLHPSKIRLIRRLSRDKLFRGRDYHRTIEQFPSVQRGESLYIMPYKHLADFDIDTFFPYELSVYRSVLAKLCGDDFEECIRQVNRYSELPKFLSMISEVSPDAVPENSLIKEFIG